MGYNKNVGRISSAKDILYSSYNLCEIKMQMCPNSHRAHFAISRHCIFIGSLLSYTPVQLEIAVRIGGCTETVLHKYYIIYAF